MTIRVEGEVRAEWVAILARECDRWLEDVRVQAIELDLEHLTYADAPGRALLRRLKTMGIRLVNCPPLIEALLLDETPP